MAVAKASKRRTRGSIEALQSGGYRVRVYAGTDPVTGREHYLRETVPAGPHAKREAERMRTRLLAQVDERRHPRTSATVKQLIERHLAEADLEVATREAYSRYAANHILPYLGHIKVGALDADVLDSFYAELRRCRDHCHESRRIDHRTDGPHNCDERCGLHECIPLASSTIRQIHFILSGAYKRAVRWRWVSESPTARTEPPAAPRPNPRPPTSKEAARIVNEAWKDPEWASLIWLAMVTGLRRGELCALRWRHLDWSSGVLHVARSIGQRGRKTWEKDIKTHQERRVTLDANTLEVLKEHRARCESRANALDVEIDDDAFIFSSAPNGADHLLPDSVTQRYGKLVRRLSVNTTIHKLRHYSATELIAAGVDIRTVAGRLGHGSGGVTTLRVYAAWMSESDQRAAGSLAARMPERPATARLAASLPDFEPKAPYEKVALALREKIADGTLPAGVLLPSIKKIAGDYGVSVGTAQRAVALLGEWDLVTARAGRPAMVGVFAPTGAPPEAGLAAPVAEVEEDSSAAVALDLEVRRSGQVVSKLRTVADPEDTVTIRELIIAAIKRDGHDPSQIADFELVVRPAGEQRELMTFVSVR